MDEGSENINKIDLTKLVSNVHMQIETKPCQRGFSYFASQLLKADVGLKST